MSGPKGYGYSVVSAEELRRREDQAREGRCRQHQVSLAGLGGELQAYGAAAPKAVSEPSDKTHDQLIAWESALEKAIEEAEAKVRQAAAAATVAMLNAAKEAVDVTGISLGDRDRRVSSEAGRAETSDRLSDEVAKVIHVLADLRDSGLRGTLAEQAAKVLRTANPGQARGDLLTVKSKVIAALRAQQYREAARKVVLGLAHLDSLEADSLRSRAEVAATSSDVIELTRETEALLAADQRDQDAKFVQVALAESLAELGFRIDEEFELADLGQPVTIADHDDHPGYGLRLQVNPEQGLVYTRVVAEAASTPEEDARAEADTCAKVQAVATALQRHGVDAELRFERQPGERPMERRRSSLSAQPRRLSKTAGKPRERSV